ncbi:hypothetical protein ALP89_102018 [Pseudomonas syringae pv. persicae]|nr:hypothetical protein ALP89_102018 [Pseudomonas syringae pv. persicae]
MKLKTVRCFYWCFCLPMYLTKHSVDGMSYYGIPSFLQAFCPVKMPSSPVFNGGYQRLPVAGYRACLA